MNRRRYILHPGDILLFKPREGSSFSDKFIALAQRLLRNIPRKISYCHVAIVDRDTRFILEAKWPKTCISNLAVKKQKSHDKIEVYRVKNIAQNQIDLVINWAHEHLNEWYDIPLFLTGFFDLKHAEICSTFVSKAFEAAGLDIPYGCKNKKFIVPDDYATNNSILERIM